ncbi:MAG: hypothetical protein M1542_07550 [Thermotogae bacterium]|jgi:hypothetical protein|nr:hypothetical protein [Thermotogota bacterium]MCL5033079.1 hypothetical protein [Thermotogota bacterium]
MKSDAMLIFSKVINSGESKISDVISVVDNSKIGFQISTDHEVSIDVLNSLSGINEIYGAETLESDGVKMEYQLSHGWISASSVSIVEGGQALSGFTAYDTGKIVFSTPPAAGTLIISMNYVPEDLDTIPLQNLTVNGTKTFIQDVGTIRYLRLVVANNSTSSASVVIKAVKN